MTPHFLAYSLISARLYSTTHTHTRIYMYVCMSCVFIARAVLYAMLYMYVKVYYFGEGNKKKGVDKGV